MEEKKTFDKRNSTDTVDETDSADSSDQIDQTDTDHLVDRDLINESLREPELDDELLQSIARLVEEETSGAQESVKNGTSDSAETVIRHVVSQSIGQNTVSGDATRTVPDPAQLLDGRTRILEHVSPEEIRKLAAERKAASSADSDSAQNSTQQGSTLEQNRNRNGEQQEQTGHFQKQGQTGRERLAQRQTEPVIDIHAAAGTFAAQSGKDGQNGREKEPANNGQPGKEGKAVEKKKKISRKTLLIIIGCLVAAAVIAIVAGVQYHQKQINSYDYNYDKGMEQYQEGNYADALTYLDKAASTAAGKTNIELLYTISDCYRNTDNREKAVETLKKLLNVQDNYGRAITDLCKYYYEDKNGTALNEMIKKYKGTDSETYVSQYEVNAPSVSTASGTYYNSLSLALSADENCSIYYTTNGDTPDKNSTQYQDEINLSNGTTQIRAIAMNEIGVVSDVAEWKYQIDYKQPDAPSINPASGTYSEGQTITIDNIQDGDTAYYTMDGTMPTASSTVYTGPVTMPAGNTVFAAVIVSQYDLTSTITRRNYVINVVKTYSNEEALTILKNRMIQKGDMTASEKTSKGESLTFQQVGKVTVGGEEIYEIQCMVTKNTVTSVFGTYGVGVKSGTCYKVNGSGTALSLETY